jgi:hypothetical protein
LSFERAIDLAEEYVANNTSDNWAKVDLAGYFGMVGRYDRGLSLLKTTEQWGIEDPHLVGAIAEAFMDLGESDLAIDWLATALHGGLTVDWIKRRPSFNRLWEDDRFRNLIGQHGTN